MIYETKTLEDLVIRAKDSRETSEKLISQFKPFIASVIQKRLGKYLEYGVDDELSVGLIAFNEAIHSYDINKGKFLSFARLVITNRLIDYFRKQQKLKTISLNNDDDENDQVIELIDKKAVARYALNGESEDRRFEIIEYTRMLKEWDISFTDLVKLSPKQPNLRNEYKKIAKLIVENGQLYDELKRNKRLPIRNIEKLVPIHRKKIERGRIYIIALIIALKNRLSFLEFCENDS